MAVTHADLAVGRSGRSLGSKLGNGVMVLCTVLGLLAFIFCLIAETTRSEAIWMLVEYPNRNKEVDLKCMYSSNGRSPALCALGAFLSLGMTLGIQQAYIWIALCRPPATDRFHPLAAWISSAISSKSLRWQAASFFVFSWLVIGPKLVWKNSFGNKASVAVYIDLIFGSCGEIRVCFAVAAVLLLIGIGVEATHLGDSGVARNKCLVIRQGMFAAGGVFGLSGTSLGVAFYVTALQTRRLQEEEANVRQEVLEATFFSAGSMDESPRSHETTLAAVHTQPHHNALVKTSNVP